MCRETVQNKVRRNIGAKFWSALNTRIKKDGSIFEGWGSGKNSFMHSDTALESKI